MSKNYDEFTEQLIAEGKVAVTAYFADWPGSAADKKCHAIFEHHGGDFIGCGTFIGDPTPERDVEYAVSMTKLKALPLQAIGSRGVEIRSQPFAWHQGQALDLDDPLCRYPLQLLHSLL
jgi:hypothetical protein